MTQRGDINCPGEPTPTFSLKEYKAQQEHIKKQIDEDTCEEHKQFCCPVCFKMGTVE